MITCVVKDSSGSEMGRFQPKGEKNLLDEAADNGIEIPFSCHAGACMSCACKVEEGMDKIDPELDGPKYIDTDDDVQLSCIAGAKAEYVQDGDEHIIELTVLS